MRLQIGNAIYVYSGKPQGLGLNAPENAQGEAATNSGRTPTKRISPDGAKFIYVMRDPVERFWSHVRFDLGRAGKESADPNAQIDALLADPLLLPRSDYRAVIEKLETAIDKGRIFYAFYERLTARETIVGEIRKLEDFLGLAPLDAGILLSCVEKPENVSPKMTLYTANRRKIRLALNDVYEFVERKFGCLPPGWDGN